MSRSLFFRMRSVQGSAQAWLTLLVVVGGLAASVASLDEADSFPIAGTSALQNITIDAQAEPVTLAFHVIAPAAVGTVTLNVKLDESWSGFGASSDDAADYPITESSLDSGSAPSDVEDASTTLAFDASSSQATQWLLLDSVCTVVASGDAPSCEADYALTLSRNEDHPSGAMTWRVTAIASSYSSYRGQALTVIASPQ